VRAGRWQRMREAILLRTIGAPSGVIIRSQAAELLLLTTGAMISGLVLSWGAAGLVVHYAMKLPYSPDWTSPWPIMTALVAAILAVGWFNGRAALRRSPAEAWRDLSLASS